MSAIAVLVGLCALAIMGSTDAVSFTFPLSQQTVYGNNTQSATMRWTYQLGGGETLDTLRCGFLKGITFQIMVVKQGTADAKVFDDPAFPNEFVENGLRRVSVVEQGTTIDMTIRKLRKNDENSNNFFCAISLNGLTFTPSSEIQLQILEPPTFVSCLQGAFVANEPQRFTTNCSAQGTPPPTITCYARDALQAVYDMDSAAQGTALHYVIPRMNRTYKTITCLADGIQSGNLSKSVSITVRYPPLGPLNFRVVRATNISMELSWEAPQDIGGLPITLYNVEYSVQQSNVLMSQNTSHANIMIATIQGLIPESVYNLRVYAYNAAGRGDSSNNISRKASFESANVEPDDDNGAINGGIVGGIVVAIIGGVFFLFVIIAVIFVFYVKKALKNKGKVKGRDHLSGDDGYDYPELSNVKRRTTQGGMTRARDVPREAQHNLACNDVVNTDIGLQDLHNHSYAELQNYQVPEVDPYAGLNAATITSDAGIILGDGSRKDTRNTYTNLNAL